MFRSQTAKLEARQRETLRFVPPNALRHVYRRLKRAGFEKAFVEAAILPEWWEESCAETPFNRALAELTIAQQLGVSLESLRNPDVPLSFPNTPSVQLKTATYGTEVEQVEPAIRVAQKLAAVIVEAATDSLGSVSPPLPADKVREAILQQDTGPVTLDNLLQFCWNSGVVVAHLRRLPHARGFRKLDGVVFYIGQRPCIMLAEKNETPARLAFHLAHELGHVYLGHVVPDGEALADDNIERNSRHDEVEYAADQFALKVLTGQQRPYLRRIDGLTAAKLAGKVLEFGQRKGVDPAVLALVYGKCADRWPVATNAIKELGAAHGGHAIVANWLERYVDPDVLGDSDRRFLQSLALPLEHAR